MSACIILAGGQSTRMGHDKRRLRLWGPQGPTLLAHTVALATSVCAEVIVVLHDPEAWPDLPARLVPDAYPGAGPLGGLASGLAELATDSALLLACDLPLLQPDLLRAMLAVPFDGDALVPRRPVAEGAPPHSHDAEPLLAVYRQTCLPTITACLAHDERRMGAALRQIAVRSLDPDWWTRFDADGRSFLNLNCPDDLAHAMQLLQDAPSLPAL
ncbi:MAG: molybdenum cofactor guanylyltransferase [Chloroflexales bacterium]